MSRTHLRWLAVGLVSTTLIAASFTVGNFGLSDGVTTFSQQRWWFDPYDSYNPIPLSLGEARQYTTTSPDYTLAHGVIWLSVLVAFLCLFDSLKKQAFEWESVEESAPRWDVSPPRFKKLKHPPVPSEPKHHPKYLSRLPGAV